MGHICAGMHHTVRWSNEHWAHPTTTLECVQRTNSIVPTAGLMSLEAGKYMEGHHNLSTVQKSNGMSDFRLNIGQACLLAFKPLILDQALHSHEVLFHRWLICSCRVFSRCQLMSG